MKRIQGSKLFKKFFEEKLNEEYNKNLSQRKDTARNSNFRFYKRIFTLFSKKFGSKHRRNLKIRYLEEWILIFNKCICPLLGFTRDFSERRELFFSFFILWGPIDKIKEVINSYYYNEEETKNRLLLQMKFREARDKSIKDVFQANLYYRTISNLKT